MLNEIKDTYDITLFLLSKSGDYTDSIADQIEVLEASPWLKLLGISQAQAKNQGYKLYFIRAVFALYSKLFSNYLPIYLLILTQKELIGYDIAISFLQNGSEKTFYGGCNEFVLRRVKAKQKIGFIHSDFSNYLGNTTKNHKVFQKFDKIVAVSEECRKEYVKKAPNMLSKTYKVNNCHNYAEYIYKANDNPKKYLADHLNIITVARLSPEKGILRTIEVIKRLVLEKYNIIWHIVGDGPQRDEIGKKVIMECITDHIILYGNQKNPYKFIKNADIFLLPSFHEAAPMVFNEAKCLGIPIMTTSTISAKEMVIEGKEGFVCENSEYGIYVTLKYLIDNPKKILKCRDYLLKQHYSNQEALLQFYNLIEGKT